MNKILTSLSVLFISVFVWVKISFLIVEKKYSHSIVGNLDLLYILITIILTITSYIYINCKRVAKTDIKKPIKIFNNKFNFVIFILIFTAIMISGYFNYNKKSLDWDAVALYDSRAKILNYGYSFSDMKNLSEFDTKNKYYYLLYPPFTSILHSFWYKTGTTIPVSFIYFLLICLLMIIVFAQFSLFYSLPETLVLTYLLISNKEIFVLSMIEYTNLPFTIYILLGVFMMANYLKYNNLWFLILSSLLLSASIWIRFMEPMWVVVLFSMSSLLIFKKPLKRATLISFSNFALIVFQYIAWSYFQKYIALSPQIFFITPDIVINSVFGLLSGSLITMLLFYVKTIGWFAIVYVAALFNIPKNAPIEILFLRNILLYSLIIYFVGLYGLSFVFDWWPEMGGSLIRSSSFLIPVSVFLNFYNIKYNNSLKTSFSNLLK